MHDHPAPFVNPRHLAGLLLLVVAWAILSPAAARFDGEPTEGLGEGPPSAQLPTAETLPPDAGFIRDQAIAFAWLGQQEDGLDPGPLPSSARSHIASMRALLQQQERNTGAPLPTVTPRMVQVPAGLDLTREQRQRLHDASSALRVLAGDQTRQQELGPDMHLVPRPGAVVAPEVDSRVITGDGVWAAMRWSGGDVLWQDTSEHGHAIAVVDGDTADVRLDDGLVVPGRFYRIDNGSVLTSAGTISVHIRPLSAVESYHPAAAGVPTATH